MFSSSVWLVCLPLALAQAPLFKPCPLLGPAIPAPRINVSSVEIESATEGFTKTLRQYLATGDGTFGPIFPNTTSFSIALFAGSNYKATNQESAQAPFFYDFHHTATNAGLTNKSRNDNVNAEASKDAVYALGDVTELIAVYILLAELGDKVLDTGIVEYLPELHELSVARAKDPITHVQWDDITLGALASHMAGIARDGTNCRIDAECSRHQFLSGFSNKPPVYLPGTTPILSKAGFQLLALALERKTGHSFSSVLTSRLLEPLALKYTSLLGPESHLFRSGLSNSSAIGSPAAVSLLSTTHDLSLIGRSMLTSGLISPAETRRWLKPVSSTSNLRNAVGRPWEIYHFGTKSIDPVIDIYTKTGSLGRYSSYFGLAPDYDVGFVILAVDEIETPDLNAYADITLGALVELDKVARNQAQRNLAGPYTLQTGYNSSNSSLEIKLDGSNPGLVLTYLRVNGIDWLAKIAEQSSILPQYLDLRLYPTNLKDGSRSGVTRQAFQAVIQDKNALVDAGTPTCVTWMDVGQLQTDGQPLDHFIFYLDDEGEATYVEIPALDIKLQRAG